MFADTGCLQELASVEVVHKIELGMTDPAKTTPKKAKRRRRSSMAGR